MKEFGRKSRIFLLSLCMILAAGNVLHAQNRRISIEVRDIPLSEFIAEIQDLSGYSIAYNNAQVNVNHKVSVSANREDVLSVVRRAVAGLKLSASLRGTQIILSPAPPEPAATPRTVTGIVLDEADLPVIGAGVFVKDMPKIGASTDADGKFVLKNVPAASTHLVVSYIGYKDATVKIADNLVIRIEPDSEMMDAIVVTGLTKTDKRLFTGASDQLKADDVKLSGLADISRGLEGKSAGVSVQNVSGTFGTAPKIRVRGATSIYGSSKPLWVVDGVIMEDIVDIDADALSSGDATTLIASAIAGLNAEDIESFNILKDGSATSIYGARAMAGVIVITTKKGSAGTSKINYSGEFTYRMVPSYNEFNIMNSQDQISIYEEMRHKGWLNYADVANYPSSGIYGKMYQLISDSSMDNTPKAIADYLRAAEYRNTDWFQTLFNHNVMHTHSVSLTSGTEKSSYYASISAMLDPGWTKSSKVQRYTANLNASYKISDKISVNLITNASYRKQLAPGTLSGSTDPISGEVKRDFDINPYSYAINTGRTLEPNTFYTRNYAPFNILHELRSNYMDLDVVDTKFQAEIRYKPIKGLDIAALGAVRYNASKQEHYITDDSNQAMAYRMDYPASIRDDNSFLYQDPDNPYSVPEVVLPVGGIFEREDHKMLSYDFRVSASYNTTIKEYHIINAFAGMEINSIDRHNTWFRGWGMQYDMGLTPFYDYRIFKKGQEEGTDYYSIYNTYYRNVAAFANATYSYKGRYTFNGTFRYEGSNKMGNSRSARWLPTWNISGAWNLHEEQWFQPVRNVLSNLSFKASYSLTADRGPASVTNSRAIIKAYNPWRPSAGDGESGMEIVSAENADLTYEKKHELNIGMDLGLFDNRINIVVDWYKRNNFDLIGEITTPGTSGALIRKGNVASMESDGMEISLSTRNIDTKDFGWTTDFIYSHINNRVTKLQTSTRVIDLVSGHGFTMEGYPARSLFSIPFEGLDKNGLPTFRDQTGNISTTGINFQERFALDFLKYEGPTDPTDLGSFGNIFRYKGFKLNIFLTYSFGNVVRLNPVFDDMYSDLDAMPREFKNRWGVPGDENRTDIPTIISRRTWHDDTNLDKAYNAYNYSTARIAKGDFIRLKELSLSYDLPKKAVEKIKFKSMSFKLQATNLFLLYADKRLNGQDPEFFNTGGVATPLPKQFTLTVRFGL